MIRYGANIAPTSPWLRIFTLFYAVAGLLIFIMLSQVFLSQTGFWPKQRIHPGVVVVVVVVGGGVVVCVCVF